MLLKLEACGDQMVYPAGASRYVKYGVTHHTLEVMMVRFVRRLEALWPSWQINTDQFALFHPFVQEPIDGCEADPGAAKQPTHFHRG